MATTRSENGVNLENWILNVGDGNFNYDDEAPVGMEDLETVHEIDHSQLKANIQNRNVMAHNITFRRITDPAAMVDIHIARYQFRLPYYITQGSTQHNGQTVEGGLFIWDGPDTRLDYGLAFQWITNPWDPNYKTIQIWDGNGWLNLNYQLEPDTVYHICEFYLDIQKKEAYFTLDGHEFKDNIYSETPKVGWGNTVDARFQAECISIFPSETGYVPSQQVEFRDWSWIWSNNA